MVFWKKSVALECYFVGEAGVRRGLFLLGRDHRPNDPPCSSFFLSVVVAAAASDGGAAAQKDILCKFHCFASRVSISYALVAAPGRGGEFSRLQKEVGTRTYDWRPEIFGERGAFRHLFWVMIVGCCVQHLFARF